MIDVELFKTGTHTDANGKTDLFDLERLRRWASSFAAVRALGFKPPLKLGHSSRQEFAKALTGEDVSHGTPALGWVDSLRVVGDKLIASVDKIHAKALELWRRGSFGSVSAEIGAVTLSDGSKHETVIGMALLGAERPAIKELARAFSDAPLVESIGVFTATGDAVLSSPEEPINTTEGGSTVEDKTTPNAPVSETPKTFTEADVQRMIDRAQTERDKLFAEREKELQARFTQELARLEAVRAFNEDLASVTEHGVLPVALLRDAGLDALVAATAASSTLNFSDASGTERTKAPLDILRDVITIAAVSGLHKLGERVAGHGDHAPAMPDDPASANYAEMTRRAKAKKGDGDLTYDDLRTEWKP